MQAGLELALDLTLARRAEEEPPALAVREHDPRPVGGPLRPAQGGAVPGQLDGVLVLGEQPGRGGCERIAHPTQTARADEDAGAIGGRFGPGQALGGQRLRSRDLPTRERDAHQVPAGEREHLPRVGREGHAAQPLVREVEAPQLLTRGQLDGHELTGLRTDDGDLATRMQVEAGQHDRVIHAQDLLAGGEVPDDQPSQEIERVPDPLGEQTHRAPIRGHAQVVAA